MSAESLLSVLLVVGVIAKLVPLVSMTMIARAILLARREVGSGYGHMLWHSLEFHWRERLPGENWAATIRFRRRFRAACALWVAALTTGLLVFAVLKMWPRAVR